MQASVRFRLVFMGLQIKSLNSGIRLEINCSLNHLGTLKHIPRIPCIVRVLTIILRCRSQFSRFYVLFIYIARNFRTYLRTYLHTYVRIALKCVALKSVSYFFFLVSNVPLKFMPICLLSNKSHDNEAYKRRNKKKKHQISWG